MLRRARSQHGMQQMRHTSSLSEVFAATEPVGLWAADMEVLRRHYD
jgi:hypothetical protein